MSARSPLPPMESDLALAKRRPSASWRLPLTAGAATLAILIVLFLVLTPFLARSTPPTNGERIPDVQEMMTAGRSALNDGDSHLAAQKFQSVLDLDQRRPDLLSPSLRQEAVQLYRQSDLLSRLSNRSIQEIVHEADLIRHTEEWKGRFDSDYKGKTILFDDMVHFDDKVRADGRRRPVLARYRVSTSGKDVHLALEDLDVLETLPLERGRRLLFGGRLSAVERGPGGGWVVRFEPDSGVLLTDRAAAAAVCPAPLGNDLIDVLKEQDAWVRRAAP